MSSTDFPVGSIVYFLHNKTERVLPAQVVEKIVRTSLDGSKATYIIGVLSKEGSIKKIEVDPANVQIFQTPDEMKDFMVIRATEAVSKLVDSAVKASEVFGVPSLPEVAVPSQEEEVEDYESWHVPAADRPVKSKPKNQKPDQYAEVDLGNGQVARMKV